MNCIVHPFKIDVTPPVGDYLCGGLHATSIGEESQIYLRGLAIESGVERFVIGVVDYCYLAGRSQQRFVEALAKGGGVPVEQAALHSNHVHDVPLIDEEAAELLASAVPGIHNETYFADVLSRSSTAVAEAFAAPGITVAAVSFSEGEVDKFASNRRVIDENGICQTRWSVCREDKIRDAPEGLVDPMLSQIVLYDGQGKAAICLHFYASHPQVSDGRRMISADTVGHALNAFEAAHPETFSIYFTGCAGDITAGKYTTLDRKGNSAVFGQRLYEGMEAAFAKTSPEEFESVGWTDHVFNLTLAPIDKEPSYFSGEIEKEDVTVSEKYLYAMKLHRLKHNVMSYPFRISRLRFNDIDILLLPTELLLQYQLYAKSIAKGHIAVSAYGDCFLKYVGHDAAFDEGGYEVDWLWSEVSKGIEGPICAGIDEVLGRKI